MMDTVAAAHAVAGRAIGTPVTFARVTTDSRAIHRGDLFVAHVDLLQRAVPAQRAGKALSESPGKPRPA